MNKKIHTHHSSAPFWPKTFFGWKWRNLWIFSLKSFKEFPKMGTKTYGMFSRKEKKKPFQIFFQRRFGYHTNRFHQYLCDISSRICTEHIIWKFLVFGQSWSKCRKSCKWKMTFKDYRYSGKHIEKNAHFWILHGSCSDTSCSMDSKYNYVVVSHEFLFDSSPWKCHERISLR